MKTGCIVFFSLLTLSSLASEQSTDSAFHRFAYKFYPISYIVSQLPYCSDIQFGLEYHLRPQHSLQFNVTGSIPKATYLLGAMIFPYSSQFYIIYGGRGAISYRYYLETPQVRGLYIGGEVSLAAYVAPRTIDKDFSGAGPYSSSWRSPIYTMHGIMTNYNFTTGYQFTAGKVIIDVGISIGGRYHYFWRHYPEGDLEFDKNSGLYRYYKLSPLGGSFNFAVGGLF